MNKLDDLAAEIIELSIKIEECVDNKDGEQTELAYEIIRRVRSYYGFSAAHDMYASNNWAYENITYSFNGGLPEGITIDKKDIVTDIKDLDK